MTRIFSPNKDFFQVVVRKAYPNVYEDKTSLKCPYHNQIPESGSIKHNDSTGADNASKQTLRGGQDDQTVACLAQPVMPHKDVSLDLLKCHYPFSYKDTFYRILKYTLPVVTAL